ncbi:hypothetical protein AYO43_04365 [Nitrospira sp. SCGC AG-212-E16]|nr:hypothetical protein AYO43_04365 [Nitrospira sp. SCGC AG-212-E16]
MAAKVLNMNGGPAKKAEENDTRHLRASYYAEDRTARYLLVGKDERGKTVYFIRVGVTGLRRRVVGPFRRKGQAIMAFDELLGRVLEGFVDLANDRISEGRGNQGQMMIEPPDNLATVE